MSTRTSHAAATNLRRVMQAAVAVLILVGMVAFPHDAEANSMAPALPLISVAGWIAMPVIVFVEAMFYRHHQINNPMRLSLYSNLVSACIGLALSFLTAGVMLGPMIEKGPLFLHVLGFAFTALAVGFHWWLSSVIEYRFATWHRLWREVPPARAIVYRANGISYGLVTLFLVGLTLIRA